MRYRIEIQTTNPARATSLIVDSRASVGLIVDQLENPDGVITINPRGADSGQMEGYIPVRSVTTVVVAQA
ncbi:hypothetical protein QEZ54_25365 [Catellatospora sp. KI3]|uniref:hypothetical protein n=1 Tax=Catellatospora sp. KI3 TaxID=3041620 RepID=UPI0024829EB8|nr:hypothetical protein [Catellatospora sp. KI3]MDI1464305.1 hypothetical protein [Catellatospora sp. KI3]